MAKTDADEISVIKYYDSNTRRFLKFGQGGSSNGIHRAVLSPGLTLKEAFHCQENLVLELIHQMQPDRVVGLGCGTGSSLLYLNRHCKRNFTGITLSPLQALMAEKSCQPYDHIHIIQGSYLSADSYITLSGTDSHLFFALESYLHAEDRLAFFQILESHSGKGDQILIIDDFIPDDMDRNNLCSADFQLLEDFKKGRQAPRLISTTQCIDYAAETGFKLVDNKNLSPYLLMNRFRDRLIETIVPLLKPLGLSVPWWMNLLGGQALSRGSRKGLFQYRALTFRRT